MSKRWFEYAKSPFTFPTGPLHFTQEDFDQLFVRTKVYDDVDKYLSNIAHQHARFWITSEGGGYGKSTMAHYIARSLLARLEDYRTWPLILHVSGQKESVSIRAAFVQDLLHQVLSIDETIQLYRNRIESKDTVGRIETAFRERRGDVKELKNKVFSETEGGLEAILDKLLDGFFDDWKKIGFRFMLLIDEIDKLDSEEVERFFGRNQGLFERLCEADVILLFTGHRSWVERIHSTTEYSYYQGTIFDIPRIVDLADVRSLIETRQKQYAYIRPEDSPWEEEGLKKLQNITDGVPRQIIRVAGEVLTYAYEKRIPSIGAGVVTSALFRGESAKEVRKHLEDNPSLYEKLKKAKQLHVENLLPVFYSRPNRSIPKQLDSDLSRRTQIGIEESDSEWRERIETLLRIQCLEDRNISRELSRDISRLFDIMDSRGLPVKRFMEIHAQIEARPCSSGGLPSPDFVESSMRAFKVSTKRWLTKEEVLGYFQNDVAVELYMKEKHKENWQVMLADRFEKEWARIRNEPSLAIFNEKGAEVFCLLPQTLSKADYVRIAGLGSLPVINTFLKILDYRNLTPDETKSEARHLLNDVLTVLSVYKNRPYRPDDLGDDRKRDKMMMKLGLSEETLTRLKQFADELRSPHVNLTILVETAIETTKLLARDHARWESEKESIEKGFGFEARVRELVSRFDGRTVRFSNGFEVTLPKYDQTASRTFKDDEGDHELDVFATRNTKAAIGILFGECKVCYGSKPSKEDIISFANETDSYLKQIDGALRTLHDKPGKAEYKLFFTLGSFDDDLIDLCKKRGVTAIDGERLNELLREYGLRAMDLVKPAQASSERNTE